MEASDRVQYFMVKARQAQEHAAKSPTPELRNTWLKIAESYLGLAYFAQRRGIMPLRQRASVTQEASELAAPSPQAHDTDHGTQSSDP